MRTFLSFLQASSSSPRGKPEILQHFWKSAPACSAPHPLLGPSSSSPWLLFMLWDLPAPVQYPVLLPLLYFSHLFQMISQFIQIILKANSDLTMLMGLSQLCAVHKFNKYTLSRSAWTPWNRNRSTTPITPKFSSNCAGFSMEEI